MKYFFLCAEFTRNERNARNSELSAFLQFFLYLYLQRVKDLILNRKVCTYWSSKKERHLLHSIHSLIFFTFAFKHSFRLDFATYIYYKQLLKICFTKNVFSSYMTGGSSPSTSSAPTIYQLSNLPPPASLTDGVSVDTDILKSSSKYNYLI